MPSVRAIGSQCVVGIAFMLAHARACLPPSNCSAWDRMAAGARLQRRSLDEVHIVRRTVPLAVAQGAFDSRRAVTAQLPVRDDVRRLLAMTPDAGGGLGSVGHHVGPAARGGQTQQHRQKRACDPSVTTTGEEEGHQP